MHALVETYSPSATVTLDGQTYPECCVLEDDDGIRMLLVPGNTINVVDYHDALSQGITMIVRAQPQLAFVLDDSYADHLVADQEEGTYHLDSRYWTPCETLPTYFEAFQIRYGPKGEKTGFVHLHTHSEFSALDGLSTPDEMVQAAVAMGQSAMAITDHGTCSGQPAFQIACERAGIKPVLGVEAYFVDDRFQRGDEHRYGYWHLILWAETPEGLRNLWAMSTESFRDGYYDRKPRLDWDTLERYAEGVLCSTACLRGPVVHPYLQGDTDRAVSNLGRLKAIFGDRLYAEIHANQLEDQIKANRWLVETARTYDVPLVAVVDSHYPHKDDADAHRVWLSVTTNKDVSDDSSLFAGGQDYSLQDEVDVRTALRYLAPDEVDEAIANTKVIADRCTARIEKREHMPVYSNASAEHPDPMQYDAERLYDLCMSRWDERTLGKSKSQDIYRERFEREFGLISSKNFNGYFLIVWDIVSYAKKNGILIGPGRGSGGGCLIAYLLGITELDPVEYDILFERFMTKGRTELPDFDLDFPSSKKQIMFDYVASRWGSDHMAIVGTHMRLKNKSIFKDVSRALKSQLPEGYFTDIENVCKIVDNAEADTAGLGLTWEQLFDKAGEELAPFREKYPQVFDYADKLNHRLKSFGTHPAGIVIDTEASLVENLPLRSGENGMVTQFDLSALESLGYVKFDLLNIRNLDTLQKCKDLIQEHTGRDINPYAFTNDELEDPLIFDQISEGWTLGMFQINTHAGTRLCTRYQPRSLVELAHVLTLVRPGPARSGLTEQYLKRREVGDTVQYTDERLRNILSTTNGVMLFQEQLMQICLAVANYTDEEADKVRKILGKKKVELAKVEGRKFVEAAINNGTEEDVAEQLWEQMEEFAKYCLAGDTKIHLASSGSHSNGTVEVAELHHRLHSRLPASDIGLYALSYHEDGRIKPARILDVVESGEQELYRTTLADGQYIDATANHRHLTVSGYRTVSELRTGDYLVTDGGYQMPTRVETKEQEHLSTSSEIVSIVSIGRQMTYDVVMESPHNFVANGIVTHNSFGYAHAMGYAMVTFWTAWFKAHYPLYFLCAALSSVKAEEIPAFVEEARRMGYGVRPPDINLSRRGFTVDPEDMAVRYGLESVKGVGEVAVDALLTAQPFADWDDFLARKTSKCNSGHISTLNRIGAFESITGHRRWLELKLDLEAIPSSGACVHRSEHLNEHELPCVFDWDSLPPALGKTGRLLKKQPGPPKTCSRACKQFQARECEPPELVAPYTDEDIRRIENDVLGVFLSSTPFDRLAPEDRETCLTAEEVLSSPPGHYVVAALLKTVKRHVDSNDHAMAFLTVTTERGQLPVTVFASTYAEIYEQLIPDALCLLLVKHDERGQILDEFINLDITED
jgi:DNA polymerase III subunit alpha